MPKRIHSHQFTEGLKFDSCKLSNGEVTYWRTKQSRSRPSALFIHDIGSRAAVWLPTVFQQNEINCTAPNLPYHGDSFSEIHDGSAYDHALALGEWITQERLKFDLVVSHSQSSTVVYELLKNGFLDCEHWLLLSPDMLNPKDPLSHQMLLTAAKVNKWGSNNLDQMLNKLRIGLAQKPLDYQELLKFWQLDAIDNNPEFYEDALKAIVKSGLELDHDVMNKLTCSIGFVYGDKDPFFPSQMSLLELAHWEEFVKNEFPSAKAKKVKNTGHFIFLERPEEFNKIMLETLGI